GRTYHREHARYRAWPRVDRHRYGGAGRNLPAAPVFARDLCRSAVACSDYRAGRVYASSALIAADLHHTSIEIDLFHYRKESPQWSRKEQVLKKDPSNRP